MDAPFMRFTQIGTPDGADGFTHFFAMQQIILHRGINVSLIAPKAGFSPASRAAGNRDIAPQKA
jgi:hypothetical protein